ncbi:MAG: hypothetical protein Q8R44_13170 [Novosphingobium sp.]|nr:hypothetical protein [Novosphingobium sp.]
MDSEIEAMGAIAKALGPLDQDAARRVLRWAIERFQPRSTAPSGPGSGSPVSSSMAIPVHGRTFLDFPELFDDANPQTSVDRALVAAYWFQVHEGAEDWDSQTVNTALKHLGHQSSNVTRDLDALIGRTPRFVIQVRKDGSTRQARKRYKLTREGTKAVEQMLSATAPLS